MRFAVARGMAGIVALLALSLAPTGASAQLPAPLQTVTSTGGGYAYGSADGELPDGRTIKFHAVFVHPDGAVAGMPPLDGLDLRMPLGWLWAQGSTKSAGPGTFRTTSQLCDKAANVTSYSRGRSVPVVDWSGRDQIAWTGVWFDFACDTELGFDFFRVHFDQDPRWPYADRFNTTEPVRVGENRKDQAFVGPAVEKPSVVVDKPMLGQHDHGWGAATTGSVGELVAQPLIHQVANAKVCGHREGQEPTCFGGENARIIAATAGMTHTATQTR